MGCVTLVAPGGGVVDGAAVVTKRTKIIVFEKDFTYKNETNKRDDVNKETLLRHLCSFSYNRVTCHSFIWHQLMNQLDTIVTQWQSHCLENKINMLLPSKSSHS